MADFVAVIRRAVDGLSDNTPEMRVKVYDRARSAVQRQLESMKPRPPETMLQRQLEKLDAAIREIEAEHAEALPAFEEPAAEAVVEPYHEPAPEPEPEPEPVAQYVPIAEPVAAEPAVVHHEPEPTAEESWRESDDWQPEAPAPVAAAPEPFVHQEPVPHDEILHAEYPEPEPHVPVVPHVAYEPAPAPVHADFARERPASIGYSIDEVHHQMAEVAPEVASGIPSEHFIQETHHEPLHADGAAHFDEVWAEPAAPVADDHAQGGLAWPAPVVTEAAPAHGAEALPVDSYQQAEPIRMPEANERFAWDATAFDDLPLAPAAKPAKPTPAGDFDDVDLFADVHGGPAPAPVKPAPAVNDGWSELKELSGYDKFAEEVDLGAEAPADIDQLMASKLQGRSYRMEPKRRRFGLVGILVTVAVVAIVAGGGYAAWMNRASLNGMVAGLVSSATKNATPVQKASTTNPAAATPGATTPAKTDTASAQPTPAKPSITAPENDGSTVNNKFTQRLLSNGTEVDPGQPPVSGAPQPTEGKSIAQQNVAAAAPQPATPPASATTPPVATAPATTPSAQATSDNTVPTPTAPPASNQAPATPVASATPAATTNAAPDAAPTPPPAGQTATVGTPEKMFLYEERLGQTSPTAIEGSVTWSVVEEKGDDGRPSPTIQGSINVPERGMTAMITFKRNTDPSLPASHLIELVFSLPPNFEGGAIDSVQRVAMKATEQDRGDPLIAVPAKITDDFHMVALNDFPDARKTNLELLRTRDWIDIPVTYRNGRRALLTMQKGKTGTDAFNKVIGEWAALGGDTAAAQ